MTTPPGKVHEAIAAVMAEIGGVAKGRKNLQQGYSFRGIADITKACQPLMAKHGLSVLPFSVVSEATAERTTQKGGALYHMRQTIEFRFYHADGSWVPCVTTGEAMDSGDKTANKVMSAALKYALIQTFCIPEEDPDADTETQSHDVAPSGPKGQSPPANSSRSAPPAASGAARSARRSAPTTATSSPASDPLEDLRRTWTRPATPDEHGVLTGLGKTLHEYAAWMLETFPVKSGKEMSPQHIRDAYALTSAKLRGPAAYELERVGMWAAGRKYGPEANDLPPEMGGAPDPVAPPNGKGS